MADADVIAVVDKDIFSIVIGAGVVPAGNESAVLYVIRENIALVVALGVGIVVGFWITRFVLDLIAIGDPIVVVILRNLELGHAWLIL